MFFILKAVARSLILPPAGPLLLALAGMLLMRRRPRSAVALIVAGVASLWLLSTPVIADALTRLAERFPPLDLTRPQDAQAIVILGGNGFRTSAPEYSGPAPELSLLERLSYGAYVARKTSLPILVSGSPLEAITMRTSLERDFGVKARWVDNQSHDTFENASFSARLLRADGVRRIILVTSSTHLWRATHEFQGTGLEVIPAPAGVSAPREKTVFRYIPGPVALLRSHDALYELMGEPVRQLFYLTHLRRHSA